MGIQFMATQGELPRGYFVYGNSRTYGQWQLLPFLRKVLLELLPMATLGVFV